MYKVYYHRDFDNPLQLEEWLENLAKSDGLVLIAVIDFYFIFVTMDE